MNWAWANSIDQLWRQPSFPIWLTIAAAGLFAVILFVAVLRAEKSVANGALAVIALLAIATAAAAIIRGPGEGGSRLASSAPAFDAAVPALACLDELAGEAVLAGCEKQLFSSPDTIAAAVAATAGRIARLTAFGDVAPASKPMPAELERLRRSVERDRYGLVAYVLMARDHCQANDCAAYRSLSDHSQIAANMDERVYEGLVLRYAAAWNMPAPATATTAVVTALPQSVPTGKPTTADFPNSASIPPVTIMTAEPTTSARAAPAGNAANPASGATQAAARPAQPAAKKPAAPKPRAPAPVQLAPAPQEPASAGADQ